VRIDFNLIAVTTLAGFIGVFADSAIAQTVQAPDAAAAVDAAATQAPTTQSLPADTTAARSQPAATAAPGDAAAAQPLTVKMATVPPPAEFKIPPGYRAVKRGLDTVYCKSITPIGTRMPQTVCLTQGQVIERERQEEAARREVAQKTNVAGTPSGP